MSARLSARACAPFLALLVVGCAQLPFEIPFAPLPTAERLDRWIEQHEYGRALRALERMPDDHPDAHALNKRRPAIRAAAERYADRMVERARQARRSGDWETAFDTLDLARDHYPSSEKIADTLERLRREQDERIARIERELLLHRTRWHLSELELRKELVRVHPDNVIADWKIHSTRSALDDAFEPLKRWGLRALDNDDLELARRCLTLARRIDKQPQVEEAWRRLQQRLAAREAEQAEAARERAAAREQARAEALLERAREALAGEDPHKARQALQDIAESGLDRPRLDEITARLRERIAAEVESLTERGNRLYRNGDIEGAKRAWQKGLELDPGNETLQQQVKRAERAIKKIEELKKEEPGEVAD